MASVLYIGDGMALLCIQSGFLFAVSWVIPARIIAVALINTLIVFLTFVKDDMSVRICECHLHNFVWLVRGTCTMEVGLPAKDAYTSISLAETTISGILFFELLSCSDLIPQPNFSTPY